MPTVRYRVSLTAAERADLKKQSEQGNFKSRKVKNALILLACDEGEHQTNRQTSEAIAAVLNVGSRTVDRVKKRFVEHGILTALQGKESDRVYERKIDGDTEAHLIALSCSKPPEGHSQWSVRLLASKMVELEYVEPIAKLCSR